MMDKNDLINKFLQIESLAFKGRHLVETMNEEGMILTCKHIRRDLEDLEIEFGRKESGTLSIKKTVNKT